MSQASLAKVHFVCTGNICRSPFAQAFAQARMADLPQLEFSSSGLFVLEERPISQGMKKYVAEAASNPDFKHLSSQTNSSLLAQQDLIIVMTREHRMQVLEECPLAMSRVFTLREFGRLLHLAAEDKVALPQGETVSERIRGAARTLSQLRSLLPALENSTDDDVLDPYRLDDEVYARSVSQMLPPLKMLEAFLRALA